jgi:hypothetical protein
VPAREHGHEVGHLGVRKQIGRDPLELSVDELGVDRRELTHEVDLGLLQPLLEHLVER